MEQFRTESRGVKQPEETGTLDKAKSRAAITINAERAVVYNFWRNFENLPKFMKDLQAVKELSPKRSRWTVELKNGTSVEWDAEIIAESPGESIAWSSVEPADISLAGEIRFQDAARGRGTIISLSMDYQIPGGKLTEWATFFSGEDPHNLTLTNLKRFKALLETGVIPTVEGQTSGREPEMKH